MTGRKAEKPPGTPYSLPHHLRFSFLLYFIFLNLQTGFLCFSVHRAIIQPPRLISPQCKTHTLYGRRTLNRISWQRQLISQALVNIHHWYSESNAGLTPRYVSLLICILVLILALPLRLKPSGSQIFFWFYLWGSITTPVHESHQNHSHPVFSTSLLTCHSLLAEKALVCPFLPLLLASLAQVPCVPEFP